MSRYLLLAFSGDGELAGLETLFDAEAEVVGATASTLLSHGAPDGRVEVWRDAELVTVVGVAPPHPWGF